MSKISGRALHPTTNVSFLDTSRTDFVHARWDPSNPAYKSYELMSLKHRSIFKNFAFHKSLRDNDIKQYLCIHDNQYSLRFYILMKIHKIQHDRCSTLVLNNNVHKIHVDLMACYQVGLLGYGRHMQLDKFLSRISINV